MYSTVYRDMVKITSRGVGPMLHWFFLTVKYQIWPLPKDAAQLTKLAIDLQVPRAHSETYTRLDTSLVRNNIIERLQSFRKDALYVFLLLVPIFSIVVLLIFFLAWVSEILSPCTSILSIFCPNR